MNPTRLGLYDALAYTLTISATTGAYLWAVFAIVGLVAQ